MAVGVLNVSPPVAAAAADLPVLGPLFQVLTVRAYDQTEDGIDYHVSAPGVISDSELAQRVNQEIQERVDALTAQGPAGLGGLPGGLLGHRRHPGAVGEREMDVIVDYEIKSQSENAVSFTVDFGEGWVTAAQERYCYNLDLSEDRDITLQDLLGDAWVERCNQAVQSYIAAHTDEHGYTLFFDSEAGGFTTVDESTRFYIRSDGIPVLVFQEYTIAAGLRRNRGDPGGGYPDIIRGTIKPMKKAAYWAAFFAPAARTAGDPAGSQAPRRGPGMGQHAGIDASGQSPVGPSPSPPFAGLLSFKLRRESGWASIRMISSVPTQSKFL